MQEIIQTDLYYQIYAAKLRSDLDISRIDFKLIFEAYKKDLTAKEFYDRHIYLPFN